MAPEATKFLILLVAFMPLKVWLGNTLGHRANPAFAAGAYGANYVGPPSWKKDGGPIREAKGLGVRFGSRGSVVKALAGRGTSEWTDVVMADPFGIAIAIVPGCLLNQCRACRAG
jgi:hypothetical protein